MPSYTRPGSRLCLALLAALPVLGCAGADDRDAADPALSPDPQGQHPLEASPAAEAYTAILRSYERLATGRERGVALFIGALQQSLVDKGIDPQIVASITAERIGAPMPGGTVANADPVRGAMTSALRQPLGRISLALLAQSEFSKYYDCPLLAPEQVEGTSCERLVQDTVAQSRDQLTSAEESVAQSVRERFACLSDQAQAFVTAWQVEGAQRGVTAAATYAVYELRAAAQCDDKTNAKAVAYRLGLEQGWALADAQLASALEQVNSTCSTDLRRITDSMRTRARGSVERFVSANRLCQNADLSLVNPRLVEGETIRREGITAGIDERIVILQRQLEAAVLEAWSPGGRCVPPDTGGGGGGGGDPLIVDLDGDGLAEGAAPRATFDLLGSGRPQQVRWVGPRDAFLVIDRNDDGRINAVQELFGDVGRCGNGRCRDGFAALAELDREVNGGTGDGLVDAQDAGFGGLKLWLDANGDGRTQAGELQTLAEHGISALPLQAAFAPQGIAQGLVTSSVALPTSQGPRPLVEAWLRLKP
ncbi:MAG: hypothetical protein IPL40_03075 [Proteobacteria bacterium]|nr:hypothetical protein [Pseudomonadota bacterium]